MRPILLSFLLSLTFLACNGVAVKSEDLTGKWSFSKVIRDSKETKTLESAYFVFNADNTVSSNIFQSGETVKFELKNKRLVILDAIPLEFDIENFSKDKMELLGNMGQSSMQFYLDRAK